MHTVYIKLPDISIIVPVLQVLIGMGVVKLFGYDVYMLHYLTAGAAVAIIRRIMKG